MILQALNRYYDILLGDNDTEIAPFGYSTTGVSFALNIAENGDLLDVLPLFVQSQRGKKTVDVPRPMIVPAQVKRTVGVKANFLCDNSAYVLGIPEEKGKKKTYGAERFDDFCKLHQEILSEVNSPVARAVLLFLERHDPATSTHSHILEPYIEDLLEGGNITFMLHGKFAYDYPEIHKAWETHLSTLDTEQMQCLVTGENTGIARLHPSIKRVRGAQSSGATLIGFNAASYESYNRSQGLNAPVGEKAALAYTSTLNYLLSDANPNKNFYLGDTTVVYWAESENRAFESAFASFVDPSELEEDTGKDAARKQVEGTLQAAAKKVKHAEMLDLDGLLDELGNENPRFYILGLSPNAARVSVRFFISDPFEKIAQNILAHYRDLAIVKEYEDQPTYLSVWRILNETVSKKSRDKDAAPLLAGAVLRAILTNAQYPAALYYAIINRVRADMDDTSKGIKKINYVRAAIIKAFLIRKYRHQDNPFKEVLTMSLNKQSTIPAYLLGRLFAVLEKVQIEAIGKNINATIKDRYFTSACASPASVFPILLRLSQHHIAKAEYGKSREWEMQEIMNLLDIEKNPIPARLSLDEQGIFVLGYYHQRAYRKNNKSENQEIKNEGEK